MVFCLSLYFSTFYEANKMSCEERQAYISAPNYKLDLFYDIETNI